MPAVDLHLVRDLYAVEVAIPFPTLAAVQAAGAWSVLAEGRVGRQRAVAVRPAEYEAEG